MNMHSVSIDVEKFAYDIFRRNWIKSNVPRYDIPFLESSENLYTRFFIQSIGKYVMFYQVLIRYDIKIAVEQMDAIDVNDEYSLFNFFNIFMEIDKNFFIYQVMQYVGCSLAICLELTLYKYPAQKRLLRGMPAFWKEYFKRYLQLDFFLNGGFECLFKHAEAMHESDYTLDKYIYESKRICRNGYNISKFSRFSQFLDESITIDDEIRKSTVSLLNYCTRSENPMFLRMLYRSEMLPVVGRLVSWTRRRIGSIGSLLFGRKSRHDGRFLDSTFDNNSSEPENWFCEISSEDNKSSSEDNKCSSEDNKSSSEDNKSSSEDNKSSSENNKSSSQNNKSAIKAMIDAYIEAVLDYYKEV